MKLEKAFNYRNVWMGIAALWVLWFHSTIIPPGAMLLRLKDLGHGGVDIFVFASGIGCYYSLAKDENAAAFLKRRFTRIFPMYWCFMSVWLVYKIWTVKMPFTAVIGNIFAVQNFSGMGYEFDWYTGTICLFYIFAPYLYGVVNKLKAWKDVLGVTVLLLLFTVAFWGSYSFVIAMVRLPIFFIGMIFGKMGKEGICISKKGIVILNVLVLAGIELIRFFETQYADYMWTRGLSWYPFILMMPGICITLSYILEMTKDNPVKNWFINSLSCVGRHSFEIYLLHILIFDMYGYFFVNTGIVENRMRYQLCAIALVVPGCVLLNKYKDIVMKVIFAVRNKSKAD